MLLFVTDGEIVHRSKAMQHGFNFPFQLGGPSGDKAADADVDTVRVVDGDIVVCATDGLWDNLFDEEVLSYVVQPHVTRPFLVAPCT
jgi:serine/threonine protein phosphatase PrpC